MIRVFIGSFVLAVVTAVVFDWPTWVAVALFFVFLAGGILVELKK